VTIHLLKPPPEQLNFFQTLEAIIFLFVLRLKYFDRVYQPRPTKGIFVAIIVIFNIFVSNGKLAIVTTASPT
jgi:hypothetical protein